MSLESSLSGEEVSSLGFSSLVILLLIMLIVIVKLEGGLKFFEVSVVDYEIYGFFFSFVVCLKKIGLNGSSDSNSNNVFDFYVEMGDLIIDLMVDIIEFD